MAVGGYSAFKTLLLLFAIAQSGLGQTIPDPPDSITRNFCSQTAGFMVENLSCPDSDQFGANCIRGTALCDGNADCTDEEDEGDEDSFNSLQCDQGIFECGGGVEIPIVSLCDGVQDCLPDINNPNIRVGSDEVNGLCDSEFRSVCYPEGRGEGGREERREARREERRESRERRGEEGEERRGEGASWQLSVTLQII